MVAESAQVVTVETPDGCFTVVADRQGVLASGWTDDVSVLVDLIHPGLRPSLVGRGTNPILDRAVAAVAAYYQGDLGTISGVGVRQQSGAFRMKVWDAMRLVPAGQRISYAELARRAGNPAAARAAGSACAKNAAALFVPCHRIVRTDHTLGGFGYGLAIKESLLARESQYAARQGPQ